MNSWLLVRAKYQLEQVSVQESSSIEFKATKKWINIALNSSSSANDDWMWSVVWMVSSLKYIHKNESVVAYFIRCHAIMQYLQFSWDDDDIQAYAHKNAQTETNLVETSLFQFPITALNINVKIKLGIYVFMCVILGLTALRNVIRLLIISPSWACMWNRRMRQPWNVRQELFTFAIILHSISGRHFK